MGDVRVEAMAVVRERARATFIQFRPTPRGWVSILHVDLHVVSDVVFDGDRGLQVGRAPIGGVVAFLKSLGKCKSVLPVYERVFTCGATGSSWRILFRVIVTSIYYTCARLKAADSGRDAADLVSPLCVPSGDHGRAAGHQSYVKCHPLETKPSLQTDRIYKNGARLTFTLGV